MKDYLIKALVDLILFLEFSDDEVVDPDASIQAMEQLSATLLDMTDGEKDAFIDKVNSMVADYDKEEAEFLSSIGEALGLK